MSEEKPSQRKNTDNIAVQLALNGQSLEHLQKDLDVKHDQNRKSIHELRNSTDKYFNTVEIKFDKVETNILRCVDLITGIRIANARWNIGAGIITAIITALITALIKHFFKN